MGLFKKSLFEKFKDKTWLKNTLLAVIAAGAGAAANGGDGIKTAVDALIKAILG